MARGGRLGRGYRAAITAPETVTAPSPSAAGPAAARTAPRLRCVVLSASIGAGHDVPAQVLAEELAQRAPDGAVEVVDGLAAMGALAERVVLEGSSFGTPVGDATFDLVHRLVHDVAPTRRLFGAIGLLACGRGLRRAIASRQADVVVSTYPGTTEVLGRLRAIGRLPVPVVAVVTDVAALRFWAHPGADLHLVTQAEAIPEVRAIAGPGARVVHVRGLDDPRFAAPPSRASSRRALGLPAAGPVVVISGGGWAVGDLEGATAEALAVPGSAALVLCGRDETLAGRLTARFGHARLMTLGFTDRMPEVLQAADVLVHSTAGLTVMEALVLGCPVVSYGWGAGHLRANDAAFARHGLAAVAGSRPALAAALRDALGHPRRPDPSFAALPTAASVVLEAFGAA